MKILIIENVSLGGRKYGFFEKSLLTAFTVLPTLNARHIAAITPKKHSVKVANERYDKISFTKEYDIVNINFVTSTTSRAYEIADKFKKLGVKVVLSGLHPSLNIDEAKTHCDSILPGSGELAWLDLLKDFEVGKIKPIYESKFDDKTHLPADNINLPGFVLTGAMEATRGCPYKCEFCRESHIPNGSNYFKRPISDVIDEIKNLPQKAFTFYDASLTIDTTYTKKLFKELKTVKKHFSCNGNSDVLAKDIELVKLSKKAGCVSWLIGFESISEDTLKEMGKKTNKIDEYKKAVQNIHDNGMIAIGCFIFGFDTDKKDAFDKTLKFINKLGIDAVDFLVLTPFPGTPLFEKLEKQGRITTNDWSKYNMRNVVFKPKNMSDKELFEGVKKTYNEFYKISTSFRRIIRSMRYGFYPFLLVFERNFFASVNNRIYYKKNKKK